MEAFTDAVGLRALGLGARVIDVLDREIELVLVAFGIAAELAAAISQHAQELDIVLLEEWQHSVIEQIGRRDRRLAVVELGKADLGVGVDEGPAGRCVQHPSGCRHRTYPGRRSNPDARSRTRRAPPSRSWPFPAR